MPQCVDQLDSLDSLKDKIEQLETRNNRLSSLLRKIFLWFSKMEIRVVSIAYSSRGRNFNDRFPDTTNIDTQIREMYYNEMRGPTKLWTMIGDTIHLTVFVVCGLLNRASLIFPIILVYTNAVMVVALCVFLAIALYAMENIGWWTTPMLAILLFAAIGGWANWKAERM